MIEKVFTLSGSNTLTTGDRFVTMVANWNPDNYYRLIRIAGEFYYTPDAIDLGYVFCPGRVSFERTQSPINEPPGKITGGGANNLDLFMSHIYFFFDKGSIGIPRPCQLLIAPGDTFIISASIFQPEGGNFVVNDSISIVITLWYEKLGRRSRLL